MYDCDWGTANVIKGLAVVVVVFLVVACGSAASPTPQPTATVAPTATPQPTATPVPPTATPQPTPTPVPTATPIPPAEESEHAGAGDDSIAAIREKMDSVEQGWTVYYHRDDGLSPGKNTPINDIFELLKLENIATHEGYQRVSPERVIDLEPDIIIVDTMESLLEDPEFSGLHMVQDTGHIPHHVFVVPEGYSFDPDSHHFADTVEELAAFAYPEVFGPEGESGQEQHGEEGHGHGEHGGHSH